MLTTILYKNYYSTTLLFRKDIEGFQKKINPKGYYTGIKFMIGPNDNRKQVCKKAYLAAYKCKAKQFYYIIKKLKRVAAVPMSKLSKPLPGPMFPTVASYLKMRDIVLTQKEKANGAVVDKHKFHVATVWLREWVNLVACHVPNPKKLNEMQVNTMYKNEVYKVNKKAYN
jgi:hypothetical protein